MSSSDAGTGLLAESNLYKILPKQQQQLVRSIA